MRVIKRGLKNKIYGIIIGKCIGVAALFYLSIYAPQRYAFRHAYIELPNLDFLLKDYPPFSLEKNTYVSFFNTIIENVNYDQNKEFIRNVLSTCSSPQFIELVHSGLATKYIEKFSTFELLTKDRLLVDEGYDEYDRITFTF